MKWLLPALFIAYYSSISFFMHVHIERGTTIVHAHPFQKAADGSCHHHASLAEFQLFCALSSIEVADGAVHALTLRFYALPVADRDEMPVSPDTLAPFRGNLCLRAPPMMV